MSFHNKRLPNGRFAPKNLTVVGGDVVTPLTRLVQKAITGQSPTPTVKPLVNHIAIVLDYSGSMQMIASETLKNLNRTIDTIVQNAKSSGQETTVSMYRFGTNDYPFVQTRRSNYWSNYWINGDFSGVTEDFFCRPVSEVVNVSSYSPNGNTPLLDGVGYAIERLKSRQDANEPNVSFLVIVLTDGFENRSNKYTTSSLNSLMSEVQATDRWTLSFLVPPKHKAVFCRDFKVHEGNVQEWEATSKGVELASHQTQAGVTLYYQNRSLGITSTQSFYTNLDNVSVGTVQQNLQNIQDKVKVLKVEKETEIRPFVEEKLGKYDLGTAFYQLTKPEKVQAGKQVLVKEKTGNAVYGGYDARKVLGIPEGQDLRVKPGNHANFDIFIQSTSTNRKLVRGTQLVVLK